MADDTQDSPVQTDWQKRNRQPGNLQSSTPGTPGFGGAIRDAIGALSQNTAPQSITQRKPKIEQGVTKALGDEFQ